MQVVGGPKFSLVERNKNTNRLRERVPMSKLHYLKNQNMSYNSKIDLHSFITFAS